MMAGYLARNADAWLCLTEAELSRARGEANPELWREAGLRIHELTDVEHELYAALRLAEALAATGDIVHAESELAAAHERGAPWVRSLWSWRWRLWPAEPDSSFRQWHV